MKQGTTTKAETDPETDDLGLPTSAGEVPLNCDILPAINWMMEQEIIYTQSPADEWRDCSGNFLRLSSRIATLCPDATLAAPAGIRKYVHGANNKRPGPEQSRSTRALAKWYDERGLFVPVYYDQNDTFAAPPSLVAFRNNIKQGTVFWLSFEEPRSEQGKVNLYREVAGEPRGVIGHMGTVVDVERDENTGDVIGWTMYHGRNSKVHNGITTHRWEKSGVRTPVPQGGWGSQRIVGFSPHLVPEMAAIN